VIICLNRVTQLIFVTVKCGVLFEVRTEFFYIVYTSFKGSIRHAHTKYIQNISEILGFRGEEYEAESFLGYSAV
jgi:hypothetical protein